MAQETPWGDTRRSSPKSAGEIGFKGQTVSLGRGLDQRRELLFRKAMVVMARRASWGYHKAMWQ